MCVLCPVDICYVHKPTYAQFFFCLFSTAGFWNMLCGNKWYTRAHACTHAQTHTVLDSLKWVLTLTKHTSLDMKFNNHSGYLFAICSQYSLVIHRNMKNSFFLHAKNLIVLPNSWPETYIWVKDICIQTLCTIMDLRVHLSNLIHNNYVCPYNLD